MLERKKGVIPSRTALFIALSCLLAGCDSEQVQPATEAVAGNEPEHQAVPTPMNLNGQIAAAKQDLAQRLDVPLSSVAVSGAKRVTWRSGALGCPEPGMNYTDALVRGSVIYLQVDNVMHAYHAKVAGRPFYCPRERVEQPVLGDEEDLT